MQPLSLAPLQSWGGNNSPEFAFLSLLLTLCPGWSFVLAGSEVPVNQAAGTSRGAESRRARPTTCPGSPGKVGEARAPPGVPEWPREVAGRGWRSCPAPLHGAGRPGCGAGTLRAFAGRRWLLRHRRAPAAGAASRTVTAPRARGHGRQRRGESECPTRSLWLVREQTGQSSGSLIKTA